MLNAVTSGLTTVIDWVGTVVTALVGETGELNELLPLLAIGVAEMETATLNRVKTVKAEMLIPC